MAPVFFFPVRYILALKIISEIVYGKRLILPQVPRNRVLQPMNMANQIIEPHSALKDEISKKTFLLT